MKYKGSLWLVFLSISLSKVTIASETASIPGSSVEQIVVTAKKRRQDAQRVPQTVDVVTASQLRRLNLVEFADLQTLVSGLQLNDNGGRAQTISLRGITYDPDTTANPAVDTYINEVPLSQTSTAFQDLYDVENVQVIRGPQGTLRGRTSPAGAILISTKRPDMTGVNGAVTQDISDSGLFRTQAMVSVALIPDRLAIRLAGLFDQNNLYGTRDVVDGSRDRNLQHSGRITAEMKPYAGLDVVMMHQESNDRTRELFAVSGSGLEGPIAPSQNLSVLNGPNTFYNRTSLTTVEATNSFGGGELDYVGGYQAVRDEFQNYTDKGGLFPHFNAGSEQLGQSVNTLSQELRYQSTGDNIFGYMAGIYYLHQDAEGILFTPSEIVFKPLIGAPYPGASPLANINVNVVIPQLLTDYGLFSDESFKITPDDVVEGGVRWQSENQYHASSFQVVIPALFGGGSINQQLIAPQNQHESYRAWTGLASYTHRLSQQASLYTNFGESFRPGGVVLGISLPLPQNFLLFKPEKSFDFEIGTKLQLYGGRLRVTADIYHQAYTDYIGRENNVLTTLGYQSLTTNGNAVARGFEAAAMAVLTSAWQLGLNTTFTDARYDAARLPCNDFAGTGQPNTSGSPRVVGSGVTSTCVTNGSLGAPNWFVSANSEYDFPVIGGVNGFLRALYSFTPRNRLPLQVINQDPRNVLNLYAGVHAPERGWEAFVFLKNALNITGSSNLYGEQYDSGLTTSGIAVNYDTHYASSVIQRPREIGVSLSYRF